ncbi:efflux RND transporter periplasmic adaptor subunit [Marinicella rhabdoformis]|uniref:efflux RND transporter periplasmic adaptor subunit n=1 Tax=Marinicella rhabdoformis TaxID=2580566 RepID=UPI001C55202B|nr:HlyD family efflux transporter periplasmic adaptor subunit [Marinicella rhabdoformis]
MDQVKRNDLTLTVNGYGVLKPVTQNLITAKIQATVKRLHYKTGQYVEPDTVIAELENIDLVHERDSIELELTTAEANLKEQKLNQKRALLKEQFQKAQLLAKYESVKYQRTATESLLVSGTISKLNFVKLELEESQLKQQVSFHNQSYEQLIELQKESVLIQKEKIKLKKLQLSAVDKKLSELTVLAGRQGVIQELPLELGQTVMKGSVIALIGGGGLMASIQVAQSDIHKVQENMFVTIDTRQDEISGLVARIEPNVIDGHVTVEVLLPESLPNSARLNLNVDASITTQTLAQALYIEKPINYKAQSSGYLYKYQEETGQAIRHKITFGQESGQYIELTQGAYQGDVFITSGLSKNKSDTVVINN